MAAPGNRFVGPAVTVAVAAAIIVGLVVAGPPADARARRLDERRLDDLRRIATAVDMFWRRHERLPGSLAALEEELKMPIDSADPGGASSYSYRRIDSLRYELCAEFEQASDFDDPAQRPWPSERIRSHGAGRHCFPLDVPRKVS